MTVVVELPHAAEEVFAQLDQENLASLVDTWLLVKTMEGNGEHNRILYVRKTYKGCADFEAMCLELFMQVFGKALRYNSNEATFRFPNGAMLEINQLETLAEY